MKSIFIFFFYIILFAGPLSASVTFPFKKYQVSDGLSHNTVWSILQDSYGFIWTGTSNGLNCYDGYTNRVYRHVEGVSRSLGNNFVSSLMEDNQDIWIGTNNGVYIYHRSTDDFSFFDKKTRYDVFVSCEVTEIWKADNGLIWITTLGQGIFVYNPQTGVLRQNILQNSFARDICQGVDGRIYISSINKGIFVFDRMGYFLSTLSTLTDEAEEKKKVNGLLSTSEGIWFSTENTLECYSEKEKMVNSYPLPSSISILCMIEYDSEQLLIGTNSGLFLFGRQNKEWKKVETTGEYAMSNPVVNAMMLDAEGTLWLATNGGVNYMPRQLRRFEHHIIPMGQKIAQGVNTFCEKENGEVYIGTQHGLWLYQPRTQSLTECVLSPHTERKYNISALHLDGEQLWIGTHENGLFRYDLKTGVSKNYTHSDRMIKTLSSNNVMSIGKDHKGNIYIGTSMGLCTYNEEQDNFFVNIYVGAMTPVTDIYEDSNRNLWIATSNLGAFCYYPNGQWKHYGQRSNSSIIPDNTITTLFEDSKGVMWLGTNGNGLCYFSPEQKRFVNNCPENTQLQNVTIYSIEEDRNGNFWISTDKGLYKIDRKTNDARLFTINDGLLSNQFIAGASLLTSDGRLYFGGSNGFNAFVPEQIIKNTYVPQVYVTDIHFPYSNDENTSREAANTHEELLYLKKEIRLPYQKNSFTLDFAALSYGESQRNQYNYMLKGIDPTWIRNTTTNSVSYNHLPPGEYTFMLNGSNNDGEWNRETTMLKIIITPPWWQSAWAYIAYSLLLTSIIIYVGYRWNLYVKRKYKRRMEEFNLAQEKETYKLKVNFFVNLVHEIRTPLSLICLPLEKLRENKREDEYVSMIDKNVNYLLNITNQLLDFQKIESNGVLLNPKPCHLNLQLVSIYEQFHNIAALKDIELSIVLPTEDIYTSIDIDKIRTVIVNLLGNAIKYAQSHIELKLETTEDTITIQVNDDGCGVPKDQQEKIFQLFYQVPDAPSNKGTGIGLAFSKILAEAHKGTLSLRDIPSGGSSFILSLPKVNMTDTVNENSAHKEDICEMETNKEVNTEKEKTTLLLVEDNPDLLSITRNSLQQWYHVRCAENGRKALELLTEENIDIIISDVMMPEMDGIELCHQIKSNIEYSHIPVILLTAKTTLSAKIEGLENGADVYMEKPFSIKQLHKQVENLMALRLAFHQLLSDFPKTNDSMSEPEKYAFSSKDMDFIKILDEILAEQVDDIDYSVNNLAEKINMSRSNFHRKVKAVTGMTPNTYVLNYRLNMAAQYLSEGMRINEVYLQLGFTSSSYFAKCFKQKFGVLPKDYTKTKEV